MKKLNGILFFTFSFIIMSCSQDGGEKKKVLTEEEKDYLEYLETLKLSENIFNSVEPDVETDPVSQNSNEDAADDPTLWLDYSNRGNSIVFGSDKKSGIAAYNLSGKQVDFYTVGRVNNIDLRQKVKWGDTLLDIIGGTLRDSNHVILARIDLDGKLNFFDNSLKSNLRKNQDIYGFTFYYNLELEKLYAFLNSKDGKIEQWLVYPNKDLEAEYKLERVFEVGTIMEGMVSNDYTHQMFVGQELHGIYSFDARPELNDTLKLIKESSPQENNFIVSDIEGLGVYNLTDSTGYLVASSQGNYTYAVFQLEVPNNYLGSFRIKENLNLRIDGVQETDGLEITSDSLSPLFPSGMLMVQDGFNYESDSTKKAQNFKYINWEKIRSKINKF